MKIKMEKALDDLIAEAKALAARPSLMATNEGKAVLGIVTRLAEIMRHGEAKTTMPGTHHV